jgi:hypothetical protein
MKTQEELQNFYDQHKDEWIGLYAWGEEMGSIKLEDLVRLIRNVDL